MHPDPRVRPDRFLRSSFTMSLSIVGCLSSLLKDNYSECLGFVISCDQNGANDKFSEKAMVWSTKSKSLDITSTTSHRSSAPKVVGRALSTSSLDITPTELFGAAARSSHLHSINIAIATPESVVMARLIEQYIDNTSSNFAIMSNVDSLKDYVKSYFVGTVAAGLAYMTMINEGYVWSDHFENVGGGNPKTKRKPDYVFAGPATGLALMEAKGARSGNIHTFDGRVLDGYSGQVEPHLGHQPPHRHRHLLRLQQPQAP